jgi:hypothetical protein
MLMEAGTPHYGDLLTTEKGLAAVTGWFFRHGGLAQFAWAKAETDRPERGEVWGELESLRLAACQPAEPWDNLEPARLNWSKRQSRSRRSRTASKLA